MNTKSKKGFTLVEIMIVVVIIGLLAAMAIPAFQKVRENAIDKGLINDGRQLGQAAQQYYLENGVTVVTAAVATDTGIVSGPLTDYVEKVTPKTTLAGAFQVDATFSLTRGGRTEVFD
ncbi:MAG: type II secretion system protein, partial [Coraliomargarita sp.]